MNKIIRRFATIILVLGSLVSKGQGTFYAKDSIQQIEIFFTQPNWDYMMDTSKLGAEGYIPASYILVNGIRFDSVGVKYKGNSTYDSASLKNPWHIKLSKYKSQNYGGITDIKLANGYKDPSAIREVLGYQILDHYMDCPQSNFAKLYINGNYTGLYTNDEDVDKPFLKSHFYSSGNAFFKCSYANPSPAVRPNLNYLGTDPASYFMYEMDSKSGWKDLIALCDTLQNNPGAISKVLDMDRVIWMLAFNNILVNLDSYTGLFVQNYYLYKDGTGRFNPIVWDLNMCFGGFPFAGNQSGGLGMLSVQNMPQFPMDFHKNDGDWPLIKLIFSNEVYTRKYHAHLKTILEEQIISKQYQNDAVALKNLIDDAIKTDPHFMYSYSDFQSSLSTDVSGGSYMIPGIQNLMESRANWLQNQPSIKAPAPEIQQVNGWHTGNNIFQFTAQVTGADSAVLGYRSDSTQPFNFIPMFDDGQHRDGLAGDGTFGVLIGQSVASLDFYIYAENKDAGRFYPARAEHAFLNTSQFNGFHTSGIPNNLPFSIYPNPVNQEIHGTLGSGSDGNVKIFDLTGRLLYQENVKQSFYIPTSFLPGGLYLITDGTQVIKLIKSGH